MRKNPTGGPDAFSKKKYRITRGEAGLKIRKDRPKGPQSLHQMRLERRGEDDIGDISKGSKERTSTTSRINLGPIGGVCVFMSVVSEGKKRARKRDKHNRIPRSAR